MSSPQRHTDADSGSEPRRNVRRVVARRQFANQIDGPRQAPTDAAKGCCWTKRRFILPIDQPDKELRGE